nr:retrovirus-related Pol polyprotein from transposon TNT 1-94 [Tanacetum cinerariifolium]
MIQVRLNVPVRRIRTDNEIEFVNQTLRDYYKEVGISHETSVARSPHQNGVVERRNQTLIEAARIMLIYAQASLFLWAEAVATECFTQNRSIIRLHHGKTPYELMHVDDDSTGSPSSTTVDQDAPLPSKSLTPTEIQSSVSLQDVGNDNLDIEVAHMGNDPLLGVHILEVTSEQSSSTASPQSNVQPNHPMTHYNSKWTKDHPLNYIDMYRTVTTLNELDLLFSLMFDELLNESSKSFAVSAADARFQRQHHTTPLNNHTTPAPTCQVPTLAPTVLSSENINHAETYAENDQVADDEFINIFSAPVQDQGETSSRHVDSSNMHTFYQRYPSEHRWTKDHPLEQVIRNPSQTVRTRRQLESDAEMCMFTLTVSQTEPKNIKEAMTDSACIESMQEELYQFDRLDVWELVDRTLCTNVTNLKWLWKNKRDEENTVIRNK